MTNDTTPNTARDEQLADPRFDGRRFDVVVRTRAGVVIGEDTSPLGEDPMRTALRIYKRTTGKKTALAHLHTRNEWFPTSTGYPIGTHHVAIGYTMLNQNGFNIVANVVVAVSEAR